MTKNEIITSLAQLGEKLGSMTKNDPILEKARIENPWFTLNNQWEAISYWAKELNSNNLLDWLSNYTFSQSPKKIGIVMAGNIPLVGFHDLISVLVSGNIALVKLSSNDSVLTKWLIETIYSLNLDFKKRIELVEKLNICEALIATGSNNTARYLNYYFKSVPNIIRKNRTSLAILTGNETRNELTDLGKDIFTYFGLGCRNVSKLFIPENYNFNAFFESIEPFHELINHHKYYNNYTYHKALFLMNLEKHLDNGFILLKEDEKLASPLGCLFFSYYMDINEVGKTIVENNESIQILLGDSKIIENSIPFGQSQSPKLFEYADNTDTLLFLNKL